jgi:hypothetical protein
MHPLDVEIEPHSPGARAYRSSRSLAKAQHKISHERKPDCAQEIEERALRRKPRLRGVLDRHPLCPTHHS